MRYYAEMDGHDGMWGLGALSQCVRTSPVIDGEQVAVKDTTPFLATVDEVEARLLSEEADDLPLD